MKPKISIIVPVYKAEKYLHICIDSILAQTFTDFELILVDDGSPDNSGKLCDEYASKDNRIKVVHKKNGGVSSARQAGIDKAIGEYTIHADPDDWVESTMLEELYKKAKEDNADIVICDYWEEFENSQRYISQAPSSTDRHSLLSDMLNQKLHGSCCNKLVKRECYEIVKFPVGLNYSEDLYVNINFVNNGAKVGYLNKAFYHYNLFTNDNSIMRGNKKPLYLQGLKFVELISDCCKKEEFPEGYSTQYADLAIRAFCCNAHSTIELKRLLQKWEKEDHFKRKLSLFWKMLIFASTTLYLYKPIYTLITIKRRIK